MTHKTRLGPIAIFLVIVTMVITTEAQGEEFLSYAESADVSNPADHMNGVTETGDGYEFTAEDGGYRLEVAVTRQGEVTKWKLTKIWSASDPMNSIWPGN